MAVYVDDARIPRWGRLWSHMVGEDPEELHRAAESLGINRSRAQDKGRTLHYDLHEEGRLRAIELGVARPITWRELVALRTRSGSCRSPSMDEREALLRRFFDAVLNGRDRGAVAELLHEGFTDHDPLPAQGAGIDGLLAALDMAHAALPDLRYEPLLVIADGSKVAARWRAAGTNTGPLCGSAATGAAVQVSGTDVLSLEGGRIVERWSKWERHLAMGRLGIGPPKAG